MGAIHDDWVWVGKAHGAAAVSGQSPEKGAFEDVDLRHNVRDKNEDEVVVMPKGGSNKSTSITPPL